MSDYSSTFSKVTGNTIEVADFTTEFNAISTAIASKADVDGDTLTTTTLTSPTINTPTIDAPNITTSFTFDSVTFTAAETQAEGISASDVKFPTSNAVKDLVDTKTASLNTSVIDIGDWDMDTTATVNVAHGITQSKLRSIAVTVRDDLGVTYSDLAASDTDGCTISAGATNISLTRAASGPYDNTSFNATSYNRGWIVIQYTD